MRDRFSFRFDPYRAGLGRVLGPREAEIMELIWARDSVTVAEIHGVLQSRGRIAYTTVMTIMGRLAGKGLLRRNLVGNTYHYSAAQTKKEVVRAVVESVLDSLLREFAEPAFTYFLGRLKEVDKATLQQLEQSVEEQVEEQVEGQGER